MDTFCSGSTLLVIYFDQSALFIDSVLFQDHHKNQLNKKRNYAIELYTMHQQHHITTSNTKIFKLPWISGLQCSINFVLVSVLDFVTVSELAGSVFEVRVCWSLKTFLIFENLFMMESNSFILRANFKKFASCVTSRSCSDI